MSLFLGGHVTEQLALMQYLELIQKYTFALAHSIMHTHTLDRRLIAKRTVREKNSLISKECNKALAGPGPLSMTAVSAKIRSSKRFFVCVCS